MRRDIAMASVRFPCSRYSTDLKPEKRAYPSSFTNHPGVKWASGFGNLSSSVAGP